MGTAVTKARQQWKGTRRLALLVVVGALLAACAGSDGDRGESTTEDGARSVPTIASAATDGAARRVRLAEVETWLYLIDVDLADDTVAEIAASSYDLVVLDFIPSEANNTGYPMHEVVDQLHRGGHPRLVLAYIDIGQAEDYRTYWQDHWTIGDPDWIVAADPDGWEGNYPVAYWRPEWQHIWLDDDGLIAAIADAGFDGIYLDWVEAYSDPDVIDVADDEGMDPAGEMADWVAALAAEGRARDPDFLVVGQNATELAIDSPRYRSTVDAVAQEQVWFDGGADNDPPGDCPLPRTDDLVDSAAYEASLPAPCLRQYEDFPESTLHVSSEEYLHHLTILRDAGLPVFTVDYAQDPGNVAWVYGTARSHGFTPFVGTRALDAFVPVFPASSAPVGASGSVETKWDLWSGGESLLRGANVWQALVVAELDGPTFKGSGPVGPPYTQEDFDRLAALGANYVSISGPGLFTEEPPFEADLGVAEHLDRLLEMIAAADLFATIGFRTGPGRSEYGLCCGGDDYFAGHFNDSVWEDQAARDAWVDMWRYTANRYRENPVVVGYKLMVEPNASAVFFDIYEPEEFYPEYSGTLFDWNRFYPDLVAGIREVDPETPILVGGAGFSAIHWLPYLETVNQPNIVYVAHQYEPFDDYTHQGPSGDNAYPDTIDVDYDGSPDIFDRQWLDGELLAPLDQFSASTRAPVAIDEFGVNRWVPGASRFMDDLMSLFEQRGLNHALWEWQTSWPEFRLDVHDMDFRFGTDPDNLTDTDSDLLDAIITHWSRNTVRPSNVPWRIDH